MSFELVSPYQPTGDQPRAIKQLVQGINDHQRYQTLLGVTGSGKTFTMANLIAQTNLPTLIIAHNKTLAAQLYQEFRDFFPNNAVSYFVSYYDYYQPEAYIPSSDTYIEKEATVNDEIDKLRLASTTNLLTRPDCIVVASVSSIYNLGSPIEFGKYILQIMAGEVISRETIVLQLANLQYQRSDAQLVRGSYRMRGDTIQVWPAAEDNALNIDTLENRITGITRIEPVTGSPVPQELQPGRQRVIIYPAKQYMMDPKSQTQAIAEIEFDLKEQLAKFRDQGKIVEAYRLEQKVNYDLDMIRELGFVNGIENYSRYFDGRKPGEPPYSLLEYFKENAKIFKKPHFLTIIDESHMTIPQVRAMHHGDQARKQNLIEYGFRLPSALDNRPLQFSEFMQQVDQMVFVSATPNPWEVSLSGNTTVEQLIRPTGLLDPGIELRPSKGQIEDLIIEIIARKKQGQRVLVTTLTKKMAEALTEYLNDPQKVRLLIARRSEEDKARQERDTSEEVRWSGDTLPIDEMLIGPVEPQYYTRSSTALLGEIKPILALSGDQAEAFFPKVAYLHSDIVTLERSDILADLRRGEYDVVVGINLLREGLDLPEVTLVAILDADKEGFLRSQTSLIQTIGRAARHQSGQVIMYADRITQSMKMAIGETQRRRQVQWEHNQKHHQEPTTIYKPIRERMIAKVEDEGGEYKAGSGTPRSQREKDLKRKLDQVKKGTVVKLSARDSIDLATITPESLTPEDKQKLSGRLRRRMKQAANEMDFELAGLIRDAIKKIEV